MLFARLSSAVTFLFVITMSLSVAPSTLAQEPPTKTPAVPTDTPAAQPPTKTPVLPTDTPASELPTKTPMLPTDTPGAEPPTKTPAPPTNTPTATSTTPKPSPTSPTPFRAALIVDSVTASRGQQLALGVTLRSGGAQIAGTQNTLMFDNSNVTLNLKTNGKPDCTVNPAINKGGTSFALQPAGCSGSACTGVKALVLALDNTDAIPDGSQLYTCKVNIAATASGTSIVSISGVGMSDPNGNAITGTGQNGTVTISGGGPSPTPTATTPKPITPTSPTPHPTPSGAALIVDIVNAHPGEQVTLGVTLFAGGAQAAGTQNTLTLDNTNVTLNLTSKGKPDCTVNPDINKGATSFGLQPAGCSGSACTGVKALVLALDNTDAIPDGSQLYTCNLNVAATASGTSVVVISGVAMSDPGGGAISGVTGEDGAVVIAVPATPTNTPVRPTNTPVAPTKTPIPLTNTPTLTPTATNTPPGGGLVLEEPIGPSDTVITLNSTAGLPASGTIMIDNEIMNYTVVNATTLSVVRGVLGSQPAAHAAGAQVVRVIAVPSATPTKTPTITGGNTSAGGGSGCQIGTERRAGTLWLFAIQVVALLIARRRRG